MTVTQPVESEPVLLYPNYRDCVNRAGWRISLECGKGKPKEQDQWFFQLHPGELDIAQILVPLRG